MNFHHACLIVTDADKEIALFRDVLGFKVVVDTIIPGKDETFFNQRTLDDIFHVKGSSSRMVMLLHDDGAFVELQQPSVPKIQATPRKYLQYGYTGISELAFLVTNIDELFKKVKAAGYETQTDYVWDVPDGQGGIAKSFLFYDPDGAMLQFYQAPPSK